MSCNICSKMGGEEPGGGFLLFLYDVVKSVEFVGY